MKDSDIVNIIQARIEGKRLQWKQKDTRFNHEWLMFPKDGEWDFTNHDYRVVEPREWNVAVNENGDIRYGVQGGKTVGYISPETSAKVVEVIE